MAHDLIRRVETLGHPRILVVGDLMLDRYVWGDAERISQEAPVLLLRADQPRAAARRRGQRRHDAPRPGRGGLPGRRRRPRRRGRPWSARLLADLGIDDRLVVALDDRPTTVKERYIGRAQDRHPQQMIRVDYETRDPIAAAVEAALAGEPGRGGRPGRHRPDQRLRQGRLHAGLLRR